MIINRSLFYDLTSFYLDNTTMSTAIFIKSSTHFYYVPTKSMDMILKYDVMDILKDIVSYIKTNSDIISMSLMADIRNYLKNNRTWKIDNKEYGNDLIKGYLMSCGLFEY